MAADKFGRVQVGRFVLHDLVANQVGQPAGIVVLDTVVVRDTVGELQSVSLLSAARSQWNVLRLASVVRLCALLFLQR